MVSDETPSISLLSISSLDEQLVGLRRQVAERRPTLVDVCDLPQGGAGPAGIAEGDVGAGQLEQRLDRHDGERVGEQRPQPSGARREVTSLVQVSALGRDVGGPRVDERARPVVVEAPSP